ncbi:hypothetical protein DPMN_180521 [Dreissena polymorpha]|uniref:Uncharacterized protein n=1 Tax=Dreissena polymorpha TaxID=45954 RepID=A0A9D4EJB0_DREPO|nr:hypothetical protein DPMN_180521 [Dreissena polymorpha]
MQQRLVRAPRKLLCLLSEHRCQGVFCMDFGSVHRGLYSHVLIVVELVDDEEKEVDDDYYDDEDNDYDDVWHNL